MPNADVLKFTSDELNDENLKELILNKKSFQVVAVKNFSYTVNKIEGAIEKQNLRCRVYTENRSALIAGLIPSPLAPLTMWPALATAVGTSVHNLVTFNPDYEIGKNFPFSTIMVTYKKE